MRSVIAVACTLPWAGEGTGAGASDIALAEFAFLPAEGASGVASGVNEGVTSAAEFAGGALGSEAERPVEAGDAFDPDVECASASDASESRKYHAPLAAATIRPAAIAIQIPLPLRRGLVSSGVPAPKRELPNSGAARVCFDVVAAFFAATGTGFAAEADSGACGACHSSICAAESFATFSAGGAGIAALRANGSSQAGIFTSSSSKLEVAGACVFFGATCAGELKSNLGGSVSTLAVASAMSKIFAAASPSSCLEGSATGTTGVPSLRLFSAKRRDDSCSCKRFASSFSPSTDVSAGARKSALLDGRESVLISALKSCTSSARFGVMFSIGFASTSKAGLGSAFVAGIPAANGAESNFRAAGRDALA